ncbi:hypothetical protein KKG61_00240 [bacterium]|nr:hypothetical protein [bacterium]
MLKKIDTSSVQRERERVTHSKDFHIKSEAGNLSSLLFLFKGGNVK